MKHFNYSVIYLLIVIIILGCNDNSTETKDTSHSIEGKWEVITTFIDSNNVYEDIVSLPSIQKYDFDGEKLYWTVLYDEPDELTTEWVFKSNGNNFEYYNKYNTKNRYIGKTINNDSLFIVWTSGAVYYPDYEGAFTTGKRIQ